MRIGRTRKGARREFTAGASRSTKPKVLVVDHDREVTHLLAAALRHWGYVALQAHSVPEALRVAREESPDAALVDVQMPSVDGIQVLQRLMEKDGRLMTLVMASTGDLEEARRAMRLGVYDYITKPFDLKVLRAALKAGLKEIAHAPSRPRGKSVSSAVLTSSCG